jgi:hemoglobin
MTEARGEASTPMSWFSSTRVAQTTGIVPSGSCRNGVWSSASEPHSLDEAGVEVSKQMADSSLYERLGGVFAIAAVVDQFSDAVVQNPVVGQQSENPALREWHTSNLGRLPGLKFMRTLWLCDVAGGPFQFSATKPGSTVLGLEEAHRHLRISPPEFDEVAAELARTLNSFNVPGREKDEVLEAFAAHKDEVTEGFRAAVGR